MKSYFLLLALLFPSLHLCAQQEIKAAEQAIEAQAYPIAIQQLDLMVQNRQAHSDKDLAKAHFLRGVAYYKITSSPDLLRQEPSAFSKSYHNFKAVKSFDHKNTYTEQIQQYFNNLKPVVSKNSIKIIQTLYSQRMTPQQRLEEAALAKGFLEILIDMAPNHYVYYDLRGQVKLATMDSLSAMMDFQNSIKLYQNQPPVVPDFFMAYAFYRSALIQRNVLDYEDQALSTLQSGIRFLEREYQRVGAISPEQNGQYQTALQDLQNFELDLYYQNPQQVNQALKKFELALRNDPNNYVNRCAYASLLEASDPTKAIEQYQAAIRIYPNKKQAHYNIGVLLINQSIQYLQQSKPQEDLIDREIQANQIAKKALPYLEKAYEIDPQDRTLLQTIIDLSRKTNDLVKYQQYKSIRDQDKMR